jgi:hypothetical protein
LDRNLADSFEAVVRLGATIWLKQSDNSAQNFGQFEMIEFA